MKLFITGSDFYDLPGFHQETIQTEYGSVVFFRGDFGGEAIAILPRHGKNHQYLPNHINYLANFSAIKVLKPESVISFSVVGSLDSSIPLGIPILVNDLFFPENRLPDGKLCSIFQKPADKQRGHLIPTGNFFNPAVQADLGAAFEKNLLGKTYVHTNGPRFNTPREIKFFQSVGGDILSQTCGPEIVLSNELEIPYGLLVVAIDYANGVCPEPTTPETLGKNLKASKQIFTQAMEGLIKKKRKYEFQNFVYRF